MANRDSTPPPPSSPSLPSLAPGTIRKNDAAAAHPSVVAEHPLEREPQLGPFVPPSAASPISLPRPAVHVAVRPTVNTHPVHTTVEKVALVAAAKEFSVNGTMRGGGDLCRQTKITENGTKLKLTFTYTLIISYEVWVRVRVLHSLLIYCSNPSTSINSTSTVRADFSPHLLAGR